MEIESKTKNKNKNRYDLNTEGMEITFDDSSQISYIAHGESRSRANSSSSSCSQNKRKRLDTDDEKIDILTEYEGIQVAKIVEDVKVLMSDKNSRIRKDDARVIEGAMERLQSCIHALALQNAVLKGRLAEHETKKASSFAEVTAMKIKNNVPPITALSGNKKVNAKIPPKRYSVVISKSSGESIATAEMKKEVINMINPVKEHIKINNVITTRDGKLILNTATQEDLEKVVRKEELKSKGFEVQERKQKRPRIIIYDMPSEFTEEEGISAILEQNYRVFENVSMEDLKKEMRLVFKSGKRDEFTVNWILEVSPRIRNILRREGKVYVIASRCKVMDHLILRKCYKCQMYGHIAKICKAPKDICSFCAEEGHTYKECKDKKSGRPKCAACQKKKKNYDHEQNKNCPTYLSQLEILKNQIDYGE